MKDHPGSHSGTRRVLHLLIPAVLASAALTQGTADAADVLALWTFESSVPTTAGPHLAEEGVRAGEAVARGFHVNPATVYSNPLGNGSQESFSSDRWAIGDYYEFTLSTSGYQDLLVSWDQLRSGTGPAFFDFAYSTNGQDFTVFRDDYEVLTTPTFSGTTKRLEHSYSIDLGHLSELNHLSQVWFRLVADSSPGGTAGASRVDNFKVEGTMAINPASPLYWNPSSEPGIGGTGTWDNTADHWNATVAGTATRRAYDPNSAAIFAGTAGGLVTITAAGVASVGGVRFDSSGYLVQGGTLTLNGTGGRVTVTNADDVATIASSIAGTNGLRKAGNGTLVLAGSNVFSGEISVIGGVLSIASNAALGAATNQVILANATLRTTASVALGGRSLSGRGTLSVAEGAKLSTTGSVDFESLTLDQGGEVEFGSALARAGTLLLEKAAVVRATGELRINGGGVITTYAEGTARVEGSLDFGGTRMIRVADGSADVDLVITGHYTASAGQNPKLHKLGPGTLDLHATGDSLMGLRIGNSGSTANAAEGGRVIVRTIESLGGRQLQLNHGTLDLKLGGGTNIAPIAVSLGGIEGGGGAVITGDDVVFEYGLALFKPAGNTVKHTLEIHNRTTLAGPLGHTPQPPTGSFSGLRLLGTGTFLLQNAWNGFADELVVDGPTLEVNGGLAATTVHVIRGTLAGDSTFGTGGFAGDVIIGESAVLAPGAAASTIGTLEMKSLTLETHATLRIELNSDDGVMDRLVLTNGGLTIAAGVKLEVADFGETALAPGFERVLLDVPLGFAITGSFDENRFPTGPNTWEVFYNAGDGNDVVLRTVIPEPGSVALLLASAALLGLQRRARSGADKRSTPI